MSQFASGGQSMGVSASASVLPMNIQDWFPLGWTGWISLPSKRLSRIFSNTTFQKLQLFGALVVKNMPASAEDTREVGSIHRLGRSPGGGPNNPLQCSCLANPLDRGAWWAVVHRVTKNSDMNKPLSNNNKFPNILSSVHQHLIIVVEVLKDFEKIIIWQSTPTGRLICVHRRYLLFLMELFHLFNLLSKYHMSVTFLRAGSSGLPHWRWILYCVSHQGSFLNNIYLRIPGFWNKVLLYPYHQTFIESFV